MSENFEIANISGVSCYEQDGTAYLKLEDVARGLGFTQMKNGVEYVRWDTVDKFLRDIDNSHRVGKRSEYIPENIFYRLAMKAKNETAEKFQALVADKIIPSIRKHGGYIAGQEELTPQELMAKALLVANKTLEDREARISELTTKNKQLTERNEYMAPRADYCNNVLQSGDTLYAVTDIAKEYGWSGAKLNKMLQDLNIQFKCGTNWHLYANYAGLGLTEYVTREFFNKKTGKMSKASSMHWTERGKACIYDKLKEAGYLPREEASRKLKNEKEN